jgi:DNA-binding beta-propeller fold protein YncE
LSADGEFVVVSELGNDRISVFKTSDLSFVKHIGSKGNQANQLNGPRGLYCDENGTIFVADYSNNRVTILKL